MVAHEAEALYEQGYLAAREAARDAHEEEFAAMRQRLELLEAEHALAG